MANPLARTVMRNIVGDGSKNKNNSSTDINAKLGQREENIFLSILNKNENKNTSSYEKTENVRENKSSGNKGGLGSLKTLDSLSISKGNKGGSSYGSKVSYGSKTVKESGGNLNTGTVSLDNLAKGISKGSTKENNSENYSNNSTKSSKMISLSNLAGKEKKSENTEKVENKTPVKSSVIGNLSDLVPKVTLDSIGKKGSLL